MSYTLAEAARACGVDKSTVRRAVRSGRISGTRDELGRWRLEAVELHRVFPPASSNSALAPNMPTAAPRDAPVDAATDALVRELRGVIADLRADRDHWRSAFENQQRLAALPAPTRPWWRWMRTTG
jgi:excisionase family DNA binding protein